LKTLLIGNDQCEQVIFNPKCIFLIFELVVWSESPGVWESDFHPASVVLASKNMVPEISTHVFFKILNY